jgi:hypothetical protein
MNFIKAVQAFVDANIEFVLIGGWCAVLHGSSYITNDLDICYSKRRENLKQLANVLAPFHPRPRGFPSNPPFVWDEVTLHSSSLFTLSTDLGDIDLLAEVSGVGGFDEVKANSILMKAFERTVWTLDLPALIRSKRAAGRAKDLKLIPELEALLEIREETS